MSTPALTPAAAAAIARRAIPLLDLTDLGDACTADAVDALCRTAAAAEVAAVCVWPDFVGRCAEALRGTPVRVATVVNFPGGGEDIAEALRDTTRALEDGADEIDLVLPYRAFLRGDPEPARGMIAAVRAVCDRGRGLKVILETGILAEPAVIAAASRLALEAGADFIKTSTGKTPVSATPAAAEAMLSALRKTDRPAGLKISGGLRRVMDAAAYLALADRIMGPDWVSPATFRLGASSLYADLAHALETAP